MVKSQVSRVKKIINYMLFGLFMVFAVLQLNDPDPILWFLIYLIVAITSLVSNYIVVPKLFIVLICLGLVVYAAMHFSLLLEWFQTDNKSELFGEMVYEKAYLEGSREFIGLSMALAALLFQVKQ
ncbi:transmembrane 220 family protein [Algibacter pectinivorans]|uniref:Transmembrane family 220, helix n=1 Tax=Algibacter pectinivorans TaxID=870482 RepID=A0A1I1PTW0_9FLAO|nr:transmembrane 220 family protein [Algibacter pectinivorans]SFD11038.1 Transmembrane family 220, helix [Algibacter pectinivorans]